MLLGLGVLAAVDVAYAEVPGSAYVALALGVVALGLLVGTWVGRARGLIVAGVLLAFALVPALLLDAATDDDWSQLRRWSSTQTLHETPLGTAEIQPAYDLGSGRLDLDLRRVDFTGKSVLTSISLGAGDLVVLVPDDVDVIVTASVEIGELRLLDEVSGGVDLDRTVTDLGADGAGGGELELMIDVSVGGVEVLREAT